VRFNGGMAAVRPLEERDIAEVARLFGRVYPRESSVPQGEREAYFREIFFANPWFDPALPSWVAEDAGRMVGFVGVMARPMRFQGRGLRAAVLTQLMTERDKRYGLAAAQLLRKALAGPQDLTISDGANETSRRMWQALGGATSTLYSLQWRRLLRPAQYALRRAASRNAAARVAAPVAVLADAYAARRMSLRGGGLAEEPLDAATLLAELERAARHVAVGPRYTLPCLAWVLGQAAAKRRHGEFHARLLRDSRGAVAGWFLYYLNRGTSKVLQVEAREGSEHAVLDQLFHHAWRGGAAAIEGRMEPRLARALSQRNCFFLGGDSYALLQSREPGLLAALERGDALFSRLEGEWWMRFSGEPRPAVESNPLLEALVRLGLWLRTRPQPALP
jgi:hypothetical protein